VIAYQKFARIMEKRAEGIVAHGDKPVFLGSLQGVT